MKGDTPVNSTLSVGQARKLVEQLKIEASMCRIKVCIPCNVGTVYNPMFNKQYKNISQHISSQSNLFIVEPI